MINKRENDNLYPAGTVISAKRDPNVKLVIMKYIHNTYYCSIVGNAVVNNLRYQEKDLIPPDAQD